MRNTSTVEAGSSITMIGYYYWVNLCKGKRQEMVAFFGGFMPLHPGYITKYGRVVNT